MPFTPTTRAMPTATTRWCIGAKVATCWRFAVPKGMVRRQFLAGRYAVFTSERGPVAKVVVETWKRIWSYYESPANGQRAYRADFEVYDQRAADPSNAQVDIYIGREVAAVGSSVKETKDAIPDA